jgi:hypothetical protein
MKRPLLLAFHLTMAGVYATIILAWQAGYIRLAVAVWAAALTVCLVGTFACGALLILFRLRGDRTLSDIPTVHPPQQAVETDRPVQRFLLEEVDVEAVLREIHSSPDGEHWRLPSLEDGNGHALTSSSDSRSVSGANEPHELFRSLVFITCPRHEAREA